MRNQFIVDLHEFLVYLLVILGIVVPTGYKLNVVQADGDEPPDDGGGGGPAVERLPVLAQPVVVARQVGVRVDMMVSVLQHRYPHRLLVQQLGGGAARAGGDLLQVSQVPCNTATTAPYMLSLSRVVFSNSD